MSDRSPFDLLPADLPPGGTVRPDPEFAEDKWADRPVLWVSDEIVKSEELVRQWSRLYAAHPTTGLYPLLLQGLNGEPERPWHVGELSPLPAGAIDALTPGGVLRRFWAEALAEADAIEDEDAPGQGASGGEAAGDGGDGREDEDPVRAPYETWPGLAPAIALDDLAVPDRAAMACVAHHAELADHYLGLVPAARGADTLTLCGWDGPCNHGHTQEISAVLRSWEERFGVRVVVVGFDTLILSVAAPPSTIEEARHIAAEHHAFCPDNVLQGGQDFEEYAQSIIGEPRWYFWWD